MTEDYYEPGELFVYVNGDRWELGMVKRPAGDGHYFCWYSRGDTAARTPTTNMFKLANAGFTHIEQQLDDSRRSEHVPLCSARGYVEDVTAFRRVYVHGPLGSCRCGSCGGRIESHDKYCRHCRARFLGNADWEVGNGA